MSDTRKPRPDSVLKTLPDDRQREIIAALETKTLAQVRADLRADGLNTSTRALSDFRSWWLLCEQFRQDAQTASTLVEQLKAEVPKLTEAELDDLGQRTFSLLSIRNQDQSAFLKVRSARFKGEIEREKLRLRQEQGKRQEEQLALEKQRFQRETCELFLTWCANEQAKEIAARPVSNAAKIDQLGQLMFGEGWK